MKSLEDVLVDAKSTGGFITMPDVSVIAEHDRLRMVLVRCGCGRFLTHAQDVKHFCEIIERDGQEYVRDISLPTSDPIFEGVGDGREPLVRI
jgi:hypothetical protein